MTTDRFIEQAEAGIDEYDAAIRRVHPECVTPLIFEQFKAASLTLNGVQRQLLRELRSLGRRVSELEARIDG